MEGVPIIVNAIMAAKINQLFLPIDIHVTSKFIRGYLLPLAGHRLISTEFSSLKGYNFLFEGTYWLKTSLVNLLSVACVDEKKEFQSKKMLG